MWGVKERREMRNRPGLDKSPIVLLSLSSPFVSLCVCVCVTPLAASRSNERRGRALSRFQALNCPLSKKERKKKIIRIGIDGPRPPKENNQRDLGLGPLGKAGQRTRVRIWRSAAESAAVKSNTGPSTKHRGFPASRGERLPGQEHRISRGRWRARSDRGSPSCL